MAMNSIFSVLLALSVGLASAAHGDEEMAEYRVKALFLYNFTQFVEWPTDAFKDAADPLIICVVAPSPFEAGELDRAIKGKRLDAHPVASRLIRDASQSSGCHIVFISAASLKKGKATVLPGAKPGAVLTVGETSGFAENGGVINFLLREGHVRLEINPGSAERARLHVSAKLLKLAEIIR